MKGKSTTSSITRLGSKDRKVRKTQVNHRKTHRYPEQAGTDTTHSLDQKVKDTRVKSQLRRILLSNASRLKPSVDRWFLTLSFGNCLEQDKPVVLSEKRKLTVRETDGTAGKGRRKKRMPYCNDTDRAIPNPKGSRLPSGHLLQGNLK